MFFNKKKSQQEVKAEICPICNSANTQYFLKNNKELIICAHCRHIFWNKVPSNDELNLYYSFKYTNTHNQADIQSQEREYYRSHLKELISFMNADPSDMTILDYGCSYPILLIEAKEMGFQKTVGVEYDKNCIQIGEENGLLMLNPEDLDTTIENNSVDIIRFSHVLEHLLDPGYVLKLAARKLKYGGFIYITQPNFPVYLLKESLIEIKDTTYPEHLHFFSPISLKALVEASGLTVKRFFTHQNAEKILFKDLQNIDFNTSAIEMIDLAEKGDGFFGTYCNYPIYTGENSVMYVTLK